MDPENIDQKNDQAIVELVLVDKNVFAVLVRRYQDRMGAYVRRLTGLTQEGIEDLVQNIFIKAYVNINSFDPEYKFSTWIYRIAHNECIDHWRKNKKSRTNLSLDDDYELFAKLASEENLSEGVAAKIQAEEIRELMDKLPPKYQEILVLRYLEDRSYEDIARVVEKPISTVGTQIKRAKDAFHKIVVNNQYAAGK